MDRALIQRKLQELRRYVKGLDQLRGKGLAELKASLFTSWAVERGLQLAIQVVLDVGNHILVSLDEHRIEEYVDVIDKLGERGVIPEDFARQIRKMASFRNLLVHEYAEIDLAIVHGILENQLGDFERFIQHIQKYLASWEAGA